jgi:transcriptional regulator with XRE-family HTH domain
MGARKSKTIAGHVEGAEPMTTTIADRMHVITSVRAAPPSTVIVEWSDNLRAAIDLAGSMHSEQFRKLRRSATFSRVRVGKWGHSIEWPSGPELSAETLWLETLSAIGHEDTREFLEWRLRNGLSLTESANALGLSRRMVAYYSNGEKPVPRSVLLACAGWEITRAKGRKTRKGATYRVLRLAILQRMQVTCTYRGKYRELCPLVLGEKEGEQKCLGFQFAGETRSTLPRGGEWRCFFVNEIRDIRLRKGRWYEGDSHKRPQACVEIIDVDVNIPETLREAV